MRHEFLGDDLCALLYVYRTIGSKPALVGELGFPEHVPGGVLARFRYAQTYIDNPKAYALDPLNLPLIDAQRVFEANSRYHVLGAVFDAAPDAWGRKVMGASYPGTTLLEQDVLSLGHGMGSGELYFSTMLRSAPRAELQLMPMESIPSLAGLLQAVEAGRHLLSEHVDMLVTSRDIGGARPKAVVRDDAGNDWIAKFPRADDSYDRQRVEWANLAMAKDIGMTVPEHRLLETDVGAILLVKRFDRGPDGKLHFISAASLISPSPAIDKRAIDAPIGQAVFSYARIADVIQRISARPSHDLQELFARMVFNVAVHNVDDHLKNTGFLRQPGSKDVYRLSPLYDVVTQEGSRMHMLRIGQRGRESSLVNAMSDVRRMRLRADAAAAITKRVLDITSQRNRYYERAGLTEREVDTVANCLSWGDVSDKVL